MEKSILLRLSRALIALLILLVRVGAYGQPEATRSTAKPPAQATRAAIAGLGPQVGTTVPGFTLTDHRGQSRALDSLMGPRGMLLVFSRSADW